MTDTLVSAVIPTCNHSRFVPEAVESALRQTHRHLEVIVVDDGSTDDTRSRLEPFFDRIQYVYQENQGLPAARNAGIRRAKGEWIALLDADDLWHPQKTEVQLGALPRMPDACIIGCPAAPHAWPELPKDPAILSLDVRDFLTSSPFGPSSALIRRSCLTEVGPFDESLTSVEDRDMWLRIAATLPAFKLAAACWWYRRHQGQMSRNANRMLINYAKVLKKFFVEHRDLERLRPLAYSYMHLDAAHAFWDERRRFRALEHLLKSCWRHPHGISKEGRLTRMKLFVKFTLGDEGLQFVKRLFSSAGASCQSREGLLR